MGGVGNGTRPSARRGQRRRARGTRRSGRNRVRIGVEKTLYERRKYNMAEMREPVILEAVRTPFGKAGGAFREVRPDALLARTLDGLLERSELDPEKVEDVVNGTVTQAGEQGANIGRLGVLLAGFPVTVPAVSLNRMCGSSQQAVHFASQAIAAGDLGYAIASGVESMTRAPMFSDTGNGASGFEINPDLLEKHDLIHQGESAERIAEGWKISRQDLDAFATESHRLASTAAREGKTWRSYPPQVWMPTATR